MMTADILARKCEENIVICTKYDRVQENEHMNEIRLEPCYNEEEDHR